MTPGEPRTDTATVLFTDLVGSTDMRSRLGEDRADEVRRRHDEIVRAGIESHRGSVVKHLGDGLMATFPGAADGRSRSLPAGRFDGSRGRCAAVDR